jgi:hypothetical protein
MPAYPLRSLRTLIHIAYLSHSETVSAKQRIRDGEHMLWTINTFRQVR